MAKRQFKPGNMLYPVPAVMVSVADKEGNANIITVSIVAIPTVACLVAGVVILVRRKHS